MTSSPHGPYVLGYTRATMVLTMRSKDASPSQSGSEVGIGAAPLRDIIAHLEETYCHSIGIEFMYIREPERWNWFKDHIELANRPVLSDAEKKQVFKKLNQATVFEEFLQKKFVGQKRFSVEGGESLLPALDAIVARV